MGMKCGDEMEYEAEGEYILLMFPISKVPNGTPFDKKLKNHPQFRDAIIRRQTKFYIFEIPDDAKVSAKYFTVGKYSKFTEEFIRNYHNTEVSIPIIKIWIKHNDLYDEWEEKGVTIPKDQEVWDKPDMEKEIYHYF
jgi:thioredoxin-related protein